MSVQSLSHFIVRMAVDYDKLNEYLADKDHLMPAFDCDEVPANIQARFGDLTPRECKLIRRGNWNQMFAYLKTEGPKPMTEDQPNYP